jgi:hypothetical protein
MIFFTIDLKILLLSIMLLILLLIKNIKRNNDSYAHRYRPINVCLRDKLVLCVLQGWGSGLTLLLKPKIRMRPEKTS